jgi:hypothetical protein
MLLLFVVVVLAAAAIVARLSTRQQACNRWDTAFAEANGAHVTIVSDRPSSLRRVATDPRVRSHSRAYAVTGTDVSHGSDVLGTALVVAMAGDDLPRIATPLLREGRWARQGGPVRRSSTGRSRSTRASRRATGCSCGPRTARFL